MRTLMRFRRFRGCSHRVIGHRVIEARGTGFSGMRTRTLVISGFLFWSGYFRGLVRGQGEANIEIGRLRLEDVASGYSTPADENRVVWGPRVLDAIRQIVEWLSQPLRFDSVVLRTALDISNYLRI